MILTCFDVMSFKRHHHQVSYYMITVHVFYKLIDLQVVT